MESKKQSVSGFKVINYTVKKVKDTEKVKLVLEAEVGDMGAGEFGFGDVLKALWDYQAGETDIGISMLMK